MDVSTTVTAIVAIGVAVGLIGAAKTAPAAIAVGWKWVVAALFG